MNINKTKRSFISKASIAFMIFVFGCSSQLMAQTIVKKDVKVQTNQFEHTLPIDEHQTFTTSDEINRPTAVRRTLPKPQKILSNDKNLRSKLIEINKQLAKNGTNHTAIITNVNGRQYIEYVPAPKQSTMSPQKENVGKKF